MKKILFAYLFIVCFSAFVSAQIPVKTLVQISRAEDELRYDAVLENLLKNKDAKIRERAALAAGRIGDEAAIPALVDLLENDPEVKVRETAAFALGETESLKAADAILKALNKAKQRPSALVIEAAGKIAAANAKDEKSKQLGAAILAVVAFEHRKRSGPYLDLIEFGLTAILRARPADAEKVLVFYLNAYTPEIRANALNALTRLRAKNANEEARQLLQKDEFATVRANAARVLGAAEDKESFDLLLNAAINDKDLRVRVSAIRSLGSLKDAKAADKLLDFGERLLLDYKKSKFANPIEKNELLEIAAALGRILPNSNDNRAVKFLNDFRRTGKYQSAEPEIAAARVAPETYLKSVGKMSDVETENFGWQEISVLAQGMGELANAPDEAIKAEAALASEKKLYGFMMPQLAQQRPDLIKALPDVLRSFAAFKTADASKHLPYFLKHGDIFVRATAAELIGELPPNKENADALQRAFEYALITDSQYNDAQLAILTALVKLDKTQSFESLRLALKSPDYLVRKNAANLIKENDLTKDFSNIEKMVGTIKPYDTKNSTRLGQILNSEADYVRAVSRKNGTVKAVFTTDKGNFTIDLTPEDAPLTIDNFIKLAKSNYFNGVLVHRVVPNFVMQDGDPRGDGNGGPGWQIRCEINMSVFGRGAVGMALSGKDTGGSQWFVTHSSQPHLDGGYTVFGHVNETDMKIVDSIVRGDKILSVKIIEGNIVRKKR